MRSLALAGLAVATPFACAAAIMRQVAVPSFAAVLARRANRPADPFVLVLGLLLAALTVMALEVGLGLVFDPRYRDFPFAPLTAAAVPFLALTFSVRRRHGSRGNAEMVAAAVLAGSAVFITFNEGIENWQALWLSAALGGIALAVFRSPGVQSS
jgi:glucan 1,3-beta-glucosidase